MTHVTVKIANRMETGKSLVVSGGVNVLGHCNGTFVTQRTGEGRWVITKMPKWLPGRVARVLVYLKQNGPLLVVGNRIFSDQPRTVLKGVTRAMIDEAVRFEPRVVCMEAARVTMTDRGVSCFGPEERLVFSVPADKVAAAREAVERVLAGHHK